MFALRNNQCVGARSYGGLAVVGAMLMNMSLTEGDSTVPAVFKLSGAAFILSDV